MAKRLAYERLHNHWPQRTHEGINLTGMNTPCAKRLETVGKFLLQYASHTYTKVELWDKDWDKHATGHFGVGKDGPEPCTNGRTRHAKGKGNGNVLINALLKAHHVKDNHGLCKDTGKTHDDFGQQMGSHIGHDGIVIRGVFSQKQGPFGRKYHQSGL